MLYDWIKALHIVAVISWMAGMLYLPRLVVYHCETEIGSKQSETFKVMERRLLKAIINPAMEAKITEFGVLPHRIEFSQTDEELTRKAPPPTPAELFPKLTFVITGLPEVEYHPPPALLVAEFRGTRH